MAQYSAERKQAILDKLLSPNLISIAKLARDENIAEQTLYNWRNRAKSQGKTVRTNHKTQELSADSKLTIIIDTARLNETELAEYCRNKGLYPEQIAQWKAQSLTGFSTSEQQTAQVRRQHQTDQKQIKKLQQEIKRKDKALAEAAAILILRKKLDTLWGRTRTNDNSCTAATTHHPHWRSHQRRGKAQYCLQRGWHKPSHLSTLEGGQRQHRG